MDRDRIREREARCIAEQPPACTATCPVHVDVKGLVEQLTRGDFDAALATFSKNVPFPRTLAWVCDRPCEQTCRRRDAGDTVAVRALERACVEHGQARAPRRPARPTVKGKRVAVVGGGLAGLTSAVELAAKGHQVTLFEAREALGGRLRALDEAVLPKAALQADLEVLGALNVEVRLASMVPSALALTDQFDAVVLATGVDPGAAGDGLDRAPDGALTHDATTAATSHPRVFAAPGSASAVTAVFHGRRAALSVDRWFQQASPRVGREHEGPFVTRLFTRTTGLAPNAQVSPRGASYDRDEAVAEASRCLACACRECVEACPYLAHHGSYPKRYIREIYNNDGIVLGQHRANRLANTCALCGLCAEVCPEKLGMAETCLEARQSMVDRGKMPPSTHEFALRDLEFSRGPDFALAENAPGADHSDVVFFPGCQLSATAPDQVRQVYALLRGALGRVGLHLGCCGVTAEWAGRRELAARALAETRQTWARLGATKVITACPSCTKTFRAGLPDVEVEPLALTLSRLQLPQLPPLDRALVVHDPCATRHDPAVQDATRALLARRGVTVVEPALTRERTTCCSFGGLMSFASPTVAEKVVQARLAERPGGDWVSSCAMCRDTFASRGRPALHLLDVLLDPTPDATRKARGFSQRRAARRELKARLLAELWATPTPPSPPTMDLFIDEPVAASLERRLILREEVEAVIAAAERTGEKLVKRATGHFIACLRPAAVTYWVEYAPEGPGFRVYAAWSHRMELGGPA